MKDDLLLLRVYAIRHEESKQNKQGYGKYNTSLTEKGAENARAKAHLLTDPRLGINAVIVGTLDRHKETFNEMNRDIGFHNVTYSPRFNALAGGPLTEQPAEVTMDQYNLKRFAPGTDGLYRTSDDKGELVFDPKATGIYPFNPLYSHAYFNKRLRNIVFPGDEHGLPSFSKIEENTKAMHDTLSNKILIGSSKPSNVLTIGSCGPNGFMLEYGAFGTIGEHVHDRFGSQNRPIFPQQHDEMAVFEYTLRDHLEGNRLKAAEGNVKIEDYLATL